MYFIGYNLKTKLFRIMDETTHKIQDVDSSKLRNFKYINVKVNKSEVIGLNGNINRYPINKGGEIQNNNIIILGKVENSDNYEITTYNGYIGVKSDKEIIKLTKENKCIIANGKIIENRYISAIKGEYITLKAKENKKENTEKDTKTEYTIQNQIKPIKDNKVSNYNSFPQMQVSKHEIELNKKLSKVVLPNNISDNASAAVTAVQAIYNQLGCNSNDLYVTHQLQENEESPIVGYTIENRSLTKDIPIVLDNKLVNIRSRSSIDLPNKYVFLLFNRPEYFFKAGNGQFIRTENGYKFSKELLYKEM